MLGNLGSNALLPGPTRYTTNLRKSTFDIEKIATFPHSYACDGAGVGVSGPMEPLEKALELPAANGPHLAHLYSEVLSGRKHPIGQTFSTLTYSGLTYLLLKKKLLFFF